MAKNNIRSVRFSDEMIEIINQQIGDNFTQKFERMVYNCYMLLPEKQAQAEKLESEIRLLRRDFEDLSNRYNSAAGCLRSLEYQIKGIQGTLDRCAGIDS